VKWNGASAPWFVAALVAARGPVEMWMCGCGCGLDVGRLAMCIVSIQCIILIHPSQYVGRAISLMTRILHCPESMRIRPSKPPRSMASWTIEDEAMRKKQGGDPLSPGILPRGRPVARPW
jgi:hypothetical protein